jgi:hypothetical protein
MKKICLLIVLIVAVSHSDIKKMNSLMINKMISSGYTIANFSSQPGEIWENPLFQTRNKILLFFFKPKSELQEKNNTSMRFLIEVYQFDDSLKVETRFRQLGKRPPRQTDEMTKNWPLRRAIKHGKIIVVFNLNSSVLYKKFDQFVNDLSPVIKAIDD